MFTTKCFIRKSTPELTDKIHALGDRSGTGFWYLPNTLLIADECYYYCLDDERGNSQSLINDGYIDCGDNEQLFLALAAMRDDTDKDQYFVHDEEIHWVNQGAYIPKGSLFKCLVDKYYLDPDNTTPKFHRATVNEIIDYFQSQKS